ncbi:HAD family hydrolase [Geodermatophilus sp. SYSU D00965]
MSPTVVVDLDKVLLGGDASTLFLSGRLRQSPLHALPLLLLAPVLLVGSALPWTRPLAARLLTRVAVGRQPDGGVAAIAGAYRRVLARKPEAAVAEAVACVRRHQRQGHRVVVATGCEETMARGFLAALGLADVDVVGSTGSFRPLRVRRAMGETKVTLLTERGHPPPWVAVYSDSASDLPLFAGTARPVLVNGGGRAEREVRRVLGRPPETVTWR